MSSYHLVNCYQHGFSCAYVSGHERKPGIKQPISGWSMASVRNNEKFLLSVDARVLFQKYNGYALTLTLKDCPASAADWNALRERFFRVLRANGVVGCHWLTEWQKRAVPHLHLTIFVNKGISFNPDKLVMSWLELSRKYGSSLYGQHVKPIYKIKGWLEYLTKHASRGYYHYQRSGDLIPASWSKSTGRMWGYFGDMCSVDSFSLKISDKGFFRLRRLVRSYAISKARSYSGVYRGKAIASARCSLKSSDMALCTVRGLTSWLSPSVVLSAIGGYSVLITPLNGFQRGLFGLSV